MAWGETPPQTTAVELVVGSPEWIAQRDILLAKWDNAKDVLARAKESEMEARKATVAFAFPNAGAGTSRIELNNGYKLKLAQSETYSIKASNDAVDAAEDQANEAGGVVKFLFERIITWTPNFSKSEYNKIDTGTEEGRRAKTLVDSLIESKMGSPTLTIEEPKKTL